MLSACSCLTGGGGLPAAVGCLTGGGGLPTAVSCLARCGGSLAAVHSYAAADTIGGQKAAAPGQSAPGDTVVRHRLTVSEVLSWLPADATPAQQDSAVQARFKPAPIHWSQQPDTLHLPGHAPHGTGGTAWLGTLYTHSFFEGHPCYHPETPAGRIGQEGDPVPYSVAGDDLVTGLLLAFFVLTTMALAGAKHAVLLQAKNFFRVPRAKTSAWSRETDTEVHAQLFLMVQTSALWALLYFNWFAGSAGDTFTVPQYQVMGLFALCFAGHYAAKFVAYALTGGVMFGAKPTRAWLKAYVALTAVAGIALYPLALVQSYFACPTAAAAIYAAVVAVLCKVATLAKQKIVFFQQRGAGLQIILYFCTLEIMPLLALLGVLAMVGDAVKVTY